MASVPHLATMACATAARACEILGGNIHARNNQISEIDN
jgi:hypothetical protein